MGKARHSPAMLDFSVSRAGGILWPSFISTLYLSPVFPRSSQMGLPSTFRTFLVTFCDFSVSISLGLLFSCETVLPIVREDDIFLICGLKICVTYLPGYVLPGFLSCLAGSTSRLRIKTNLNAKAQFSNFDTC